MGREESCLQFDRVICLAVFADRKFKPPVRAELIGGPGLRVSRSLPPPTPDSPCRVDAAATRLRQTAS
jgi:hypothetical protein